MSLRIEPNAVPIPGYRLIERLGGGGFGEVWKAKAPGGLQKAIKFVYGEVDDNAASTLQDASSVNFMAVAEGNAVEAHAPKPARSTENSAISFGRDHSDGLRANQEFTSLKRVKAVRHPYILSLERIDVIQHQLVIVMELADMTLWDRFRECRNNGMMGIPRDELLNYMDETAEALDFMNEHYQLQHLDIKPQNIFLVSGHIKVGDFGLVKDMADRQNATITGGVTPVYAAPETFDNWLSRQSDQYSLAIVYQELLTGQRPFAGSSMKQLILHHLQSAPDLSLLPTTDRACMARALSKNPDDRFPACRDFIKRLRETTGAKPSNGESNGKSYPAVAITQNAETDTRLTADARGYAAGRVKPAEPNFSTEDAVVGIRPQILPPRPVQAPAAVPNEIPLTNGDPFNKALAAPGSASRPMQEKAALSTQVPQVLPGILQPALIVGLGQSGIETLTNLRRRLHEEFGVADPLPQLRLLAIDTDPDAIQQAITNPTRAVLQAQETVLTRLHRPAHYIKARDGKLPTDSWLNPKLLYRIPREKNHAGLRALGRLAFVDNYRTIAKRMESELLACCLPDTLNDPDATRGLGLRSTTPRVYIVTSLTGSTGSGMFLDAAYLLRKLLREQGHDEAEIVGVFFVPKICDDARYASVIPNTYAALVELHHYTQRQALFTGQYEASSSSKDRVSESGPAFQRCIMLPLPELKGPLTSDTNAATMTLASDCLYRDLATQLGSVSDKERRQILQRSPASQRSNGIPVQSLGMFRILWPRHALLERCARQLCSQMVTRWMSKDAKALVDTIRPWTQSCWESLGMRAEDLIQHFQMLAERALKKQPEQLLAEILNPLKEALGGTGKQSKDVNLGAVVQAMDRLDGLVGSPEENRTTPVNPAEPSLLERCLAEVAHVIADECEQKLAEMAVKLIEDPNYRLAGAEEALRQFGATVEQALQSQETLAKDLHEQSQKLHQRILQRIDKPLNAEPHSSTSWGVSLPGRTPTGKKGISAGDFFELVRTYAKARYHSLVLAHLNRFYVGLRGHLSDQIREVGFCRQRLGELGALLQPPAAPEGKKFAQKLGESVLFPGGCANMNEAIDKISQEITYDDMLCFDERVQKWIGTHCQALLQVCMGSSTTVKELATAMLQEAEAFLDERLRGISVTEMYLARKRAEGESDVDERIVEDLQSCYKKAVPDLGQPTKANELSIACLPNDAQGDEMQRMLKCCFPGLKLLLTDRQDEMVFYREVTNMQWQDLEQLGAVAHEIYQKRLASDPSSLHSREDVLEWQTLDLHR